MSTYRLFDINRATRDFATQFADFHNFTAGDWVITRVGTTPTEAVQSAIGGTLLITTSAAAPDLDGLQWAGGSGSIKTQYALTVGKKLQFTSSIQIGNATLPGIIAGLYSVATDPLGTPPSDGIFFRKAGGATRLFAVVRKAGVETTLDTQIDLVAATNYDLEFYYDGSHSTISFFVNRVKIGALPVASGPAAASLLALSAGIKNSTAAANTLTLDYLGAQVQR